MRYKICGIRRAEDIAALNMYPPDYAGFIFAKSPRQVTPEQAAKLTAALDKAITPVGVFVNADNSEILRIAEECGLKVIQLHGDESAGDARFFKERGYDVWKAVHVGKDGWENYREIPADKYLFDTYKQGLYGGTGEPFDRKLLAGVERESLIIAGGLNPDNIRLACEYGAWMLDINSGAEGADGFKDADKIKRVHEILKG